jgi:hypothetical protein
VNRRVPVGNEPFVGGVHAGLGLAGLVAVGCSIGSEADVRFAPPMVAGTDSGADSGRETDGGTTDEDEASGTSAVGGSATTGGGVEGETTGGGGEDAGIDGSSSDGSSTGDAPVVEVDCDPGFALAPALPAVGGSVRASYTANTPYVYVDMWAEGPGPITVDNFGLVGDGPWTWSWDVGAMTSGQWTLTFVRDTDVPQGTCAISIP